MGIEDVKVIREDVLEAMRENDRLGDAEFLKRNGFREDRSHYVIYNGRAYSSKAVLGVAQKYSGKRTPQNLNHFKGGSPTINKLRELGFTDFSSTKAGADAILGKSGETSNQAGHQSYIEGERLFREMSIFNRQPQLTADAKATHGVTCQACGFNYEEQYGPLGRGYIECHHIQPLSEGNGEGKEINVHDVAVLCSNCHRMIHRSDPALTVSKLQNLIATAKFDQR